MTHCPFRMLSAALWAAANFAAAAAAADCSMEALNGFGVARTKVESAAPVAAAAETPAYCRVRGTVVTTGEGAPDGSARFELHLPANWNGKFLFYGVGGLAGSIPPAFDSENALPRGYAIAITDTGHTAPGTDGRWSLTADNRPDPAKIADYYFRAAHGVAVAAKELVRKHYAAEIRRAYFGGCSNGGRMALMEAQRYPEDFDGIIAGAPFMSVRAPFTTLRVTKAMTPAGVIPPQLWPAIDQAMLASCDAVDGTKDGLIQNPGRCAFDPRSMICKNGESADCLTPEQAQTLQQWSEPVRDARGRVVQPGLSLTDGGGRGGFIAWNTGVSAPDFSKPDPWVAGAPIGYQFARSIVNDLVERDAAYQTLRFDISPQGVIGDAALKLYDERTSAGNADDPARLRPFIRQGKKLLMYHGFSDPALTPYRTMLYYEKLADLTKGGYAELRKNVRLFMVPGMQHCAGGPGPNTFPLLETLDRWVSDGAAPSQILATKFKNDRRADGVERTMPLCNFPEQAKYKGTGDINDAANWTCSATPSLLETGPNGRASGLPR